MNKIFNITLLFLLLASTSLVAWTFKDVENEYKSEKENTQKYESPRESRNDSYRDNSYDEYVDGNKEQSRDNPRQNSRNYDEYENGDNPRSSNKRVQNREYSEYEDISSNESRKNNYSQYSDIKERPRVEHVNKKYNEYKDVKSSQNYDENIYGDDIDISDINIDEELSSDNSYNDDIYSDVQEQDNSYVEPKKESNYRDTFKDYSKKPQTNFKDTNLGRSSKYYKEDFNNRNNYEKQVSKKVFDRDNDGVNDSNDRCSRTPSGVSVDVKGCPYDRDGDGIFDYKDKCLKTASNAKVDRNGCSSNTIHKVLTLEFEKNTNRIKYKSFASIKKFSAFMHKNTKYRAEIIGYTDSSGDASSQMELSKRRAEATKEAMIIEGVDSSRMSVSGRGSENPMYSNRTKKGREGNNRIEVKLRD